MIKLAICGLGRWGHRLVESVQHVSPDIRFTHAVTRNPTRSAAFAERAGLKLTAHYDDVLADPGIDGIVLATPHSRHHGEMLAAARAGKHVFVEKPITLSRSDAEDALATVADAGLVLGIGFGRRFTPSFRELMRRLHRGEIGEVLHVEGHSSGPSGYRLTVDNWRSNRIESPAGAMTARGIHALDLMIATAGPVTSVFCRSEHRAIDVALDDTTSASLGFSSGATGTLTTLFATADLWRVQVFGTKGWMEVQDDVRLVLRDLAACTTTLEFNPIDKERAALEAFGRAIRGDQQFPIAASDAINGIAALEAMVASAASGQAVAIQP